MSRLPSSPTRRRVALLTATVALCIAALVAPSTSGAYIASVQNSTNTTTTKASFTCADAVALDKANAYFAYALNEASGSTVAVDSSAVPANGTYLGSMTTDTTTPTACKYDAPGAYLLNGSTSNVSTPTLVTNPQIFSVEVWFKTTVKSGKLMGFGNLQSGSSSSYDRHLYISSTGQVIFGVYNNAARIVTSPLTYTDNVWHHAVGTFSAAGMTLYMDGAVVASATTSPTFTTVVSYNGYWRVGHDNQNGWPSTGANPFYTGSMKFAAAYKVALTPAQVLRHYNFGKL